MRATDRRFRWLGVAVWATAAGCSNLEPTADLPGAVSVEVHTFGSDLPISPYTVALSDATAPLSRTIFIQGTVVFEGLVPGPRSVTLGAVPPNCDLSPSTPQPVEVSSGTSAQVGFTVTCLGTGVRVEVRSTGVDPDPFYSILLNGSIAGGVVIGQAGGQVTRLEPGSYRLALDDVAPNCALEAGGVDSPIPVTVAFRTVTRVVISASCVALTGSVRVRVSTTGDDLDPDGYLVSGQDQTRSIGLSAEVVLDRLGEGDQEIRLQAVARNCQVVGGAFRTVRVTVGGVTRDTVSTAFEVTCPRTWTVAFSRQGQVGAVSADGSLLDFFGQGQGPVWAPDGRRLAFQCGTRRVCRLGFDGAVQPVPIEVEEGEELSFPAWRSDGTLSMIVSIPGDYYTLDEFQLYLVAPSGAETRIDLPDFWGASAPAWSPDGTRLAFTCYIVGARAPDLCLVGADGKGLVRLTANSGVYDHPNWSPDGQRIVFVTGGLTPETRELATMKADGTDVIRLNLAGDSPAWSPDGRQIVFSWGGDLFNLPGLFLVGADGTGLTRLTTGDDTEPSWRPSPGSGAFLARRTR